MAGSTFLFLEAAPVSVRFRAAEAESGWAAALAYLAEVQLLAPEVDSREQADETLGPVIGFRERAAGFPERADVLAADFHELAVDSLAQVAGFLARADEPEVELLVPAADSRAFAAALADSAEVHSHAPEADSLGWAGELAVDFPVRVAGFLARADEPEVELLVPAADFRAWPAALVDSAEVHSLPLEADSRELAARPDSSERAGSRGPVADYRAPLVSRVALRLAYSAALQVPFLLRVAVGDWLALPRLCLPAALERASHSPRCETSSVWVSYGQRESLEPTEPSS